MIYEILGSFIDLSAVTAVDDHLEADQYGSYKIRLDFAGVRDPYWLSTNKYLPWDMAHARQAMRDIQRELERRGPPQGLLERAAWPFRFEDQALDLSKVRAIARVERIANTHYDHRNRGRPVTNVKFQFTAVIAGQAPLVATLDNTPDVRVTPLHTIHEKLMRQWMAAMGWQDAA